MWQNKRPHQALGFFHTSGHQCRTCSQPTVHCGTRPLAPRHCPCITLQGWMCAGKHSNFSQIHGTSLLAKAVAAAHAQMNTTFFWQAPAEKSKAVCGSPKANVRVEQPWGQQPALTSVGTAPRWACLHWPASLANAGASFFLAEEVKD